MSDVNASSRDKILEVAEALYARRGFAGVGMREVAGAVGFGKSSLFHHFRSKVQLYLAVLERVLARIEVRLQPILELQLGAAEKLDRWIDALIDELAEQPATARMLLRALFEEEAFDTGNWPEGQAVDRRLATVLEGIVQTLIGATIFHFASGGIGEGLLGGPLLSAEAVRERKAETKAFFHYGLATRPEQSGKGEKS